MQLERGVDRVDTDDDQTKDTEGRMDRGAGVVRGSETTGSKTASNQRQVGIWGKGRERK